MIKFFSRIKRSLLSENRISKYLVYSLGEIALVVVGILIAIQLNNWNENEKKRVEAQNFNVRLSEQVIRNIDQTLDALESTREQFNGLTALMRMVGKPIEPLSHQEMDSLIYYAAIDYDLELDLNTLKEAKENGRLSLIKNESLRIALFEYSAIVDLMEKRIDIANTDNNNFMVPYFYENISFRTLNANLSESYRKEIGDSKLEESNYERILMDRQFENLLYTRLTYSEEMLSSYEELHEHLEYIKQLIYIE